MATGNGVSESTWRRPVHPDTRWRYVREAFFKTSLWSLVESVQKSTKEKLGQPKGLCNLVAPISIFLVTAFQQVTLLVVIITKGVVVAVHVS